MEHEVTMNNARVEATQRGYMVTMPDDKEVYFRLADYDGSVSRCYSALKKYLGEHAAE